MAGRKRGMEIATMFFQHTTAVSTLIGVCLLAAMFFLSCDNPSVVQPERVVPRVLSLTVTPDTDNPFAARGRVHLSGATSVVVQYSEDSSFSLSTPPIPVADNSAYFTLLGLTTSTRYNTRVKATSITGEEVLSVTTALTTTAAPTGLPALTIRLNNQPSAGYVLLGINGGSKACAIIVDRNGRPVWYRKFEEAVIDFQLQPTGQYSVYSTTSGLRQFYLLDKGGRIVGTRASQTVEETGPHELKVFSDGSYWLFGSEYRSMDLTGIGGLSDARVRGLTLEYHRGGGSSFTWNTFDHFQITDATPDISLTGANVNPWHANSIDRDRDGNFLISFRNMDEVTKINATTGGIMWRLGGENNQFTFVSDPLNGFSHQHAVRRLANGNILLFDNGNLHTPPVSRAVEYRLDEEMRTATLAWEYRHTPPLYGFAQGFAQRLDNGNTLICYGTMPRVLEVDAAGTVHWDLTLDEPNHFLYRAIRIQDLY